MKKSNDKDFNLEDLDREEIDDSSEYKKREVEPDETVWQKPDTIVESELKASTHKSSEDLINKAANSARYSRNAEIARANRELLKERRASRRNRNIITLAVLLLLMAAALFFFYWYQDTDQDWRDWQAMLFNNVQTEDESESTTSEEETEETTSTTTYEIVEVPTRANWVNRGSQE